MIYQKLVKKAVSHFDMENILKNEAVNILNSIRYDSVIHQTLVASHMYGRYLVIQEGEEVSADHASPEVKPISLPMKEAINYWQKKVPTTPGKFYDLAEVQRVNAFTVSGIGGMDMILDMYNSLGKSFKNGESFHQWKSQYKDLWIENGWTGKNAWRVDNIFRTNIQTAYNVGRYTQMIQVVDNRPYWMYIAVNDTRTRPTHLALNEKVFLYDHEFWDVFYPPNGYRCRCTVITLSDRQMKKKGLELEKLNPYGGLIEPIDPKTKQKLPARPLMPDRGFEGNPAKEHYKPDLEKYPDWLKKAFDEAKTIANAKPVKKPKPEPEKKPEPKKTIDRLREFKPESDPLESISKLEKFIQNDIKENGGINKWLETLISRRS